MSLAKIPFLLSGTVAGYVCMTPPNPSVPPEQRPKDLTTYERFFSGVVRIYSFTFKCLIISSSFLEAIVIAASHCPSHPLSQRILDHLIAGPPSLARRVTFSPLFVAGTVIGVLGGAFRYQCYRTLGKLFTFEVSIKKEHKLVTEGPYSIVRHPAYTGAILCTWGLGATYVAPGSWLRECGILGTLGGKVAVGAYVASLLYGQVTVIKRAPLEDALLKKQFGEEWDAYAKRVPYRIFPYIY